MREQLGATGLRLAAMLTLSPDPGLTPGPAPAGEVSLPERSGYSAPLPLTVVPVSPPSPHSAQTNQLHPTLGLDCLLGLQSLHLLCDPRGYRVGWLCRVQSMCGLGQLPDQEREGTKSSYQPPPEETQVVGVYQSD